MRINHNANKSTFFYGAMIGLLFIIVVYSMLSEKVAYNDGAGWDGLFYRSTTFDFKDKILTHGYDSYRLQRILPFGLINVFFHFTNLEISNSASMAGIQILNVMCLLLGVLYFFKIVAVLKLALPFGIIGFAALFYNYPVLKLLGYYPFLSDTYALTFALLQFYFFVTRKNNKLVLISIFGAFIWPTLLVSGLLLAYFPNTPIIVRTGDGIRKKTRISALKIVCALLIPVMFTFMYVLKPGIILSLYSGTRFINNTMLAISLVSLSIYIYVLLAPIDFPIKMNVKRLLENIKIMNIIIFIGLYVGISLTIRFLSNGTALISPATMLLTRVVLPPSVDPAVFLISNFMYYGPIVILAILFWERAIFKYAEYGYSYFVVISMSLVMTLNSESRHLIGFLPFLVLPLLDALSKNGVAKTTIKFAVGFAIASVILSRFWYRINVTGIEEAFRSRYKDGIMQNGIIDLHSYQEFPAQRYFMAQGPWMSHDMYFLFLLIFIGFYLTLSAYYFRKKT